MQVKKFNLAFIDDKFTDYVQDTFKSIFENEALTDIILVCDDNLFLKAHKFVHTFGDTHLYLNHLDQANLQLTREPKPLPKLKLSKEIKNIFDFKYDDIEVVDYESHPLISAPIAV